jgi:hypothetical protein
MLVRKLQSLLAGIYDVHLECDVADFVTSDPGHLPAAVRATGTDEQLLVATMADELALTLFLDAGVIAHLGRDDPLDRLDGGNIADYWTALEGVSHFVCVAWHARHDRAVSLLALEMQAEIDKYVSTYVLLRRQSPGRFPRELHRLLFERTRIDERLAGSRAGLYRKAARYAARFCRQLERGLLCAARPSQDVLGAELRRFYRLPEPRKLSYIERLN